MQVSSTCVHVSLNAQRVQVVVCTCESDLHHSGWNNVYTDFVDSSLTVCSPDDTIGDVKKLVAAQTGTRPDKIVLKKWYGPCVPNIPT